MNKNFFLNLLILSFTFFIFIIPGNIFGSEIPKKIDFVVKRNEKLFGSHRISFEKNSLGDLLVDIDINLEVKVGFLKLFSYTHSNKEVWRNNKLIKINTKTDDNGKIYFLNGKLEEKGFLVENQEEKKILPPDIVPTSYWNYKVINKKNWLDTQRGILLDIEITENQNEIIQNFTGEEFLAKRFDISNDLSLSLWYSGESLVKISFEARGSKIDYFRK